MRKVTCAIWKQIIYAGRKMQRNLTTDTICQNLLLRSVTSELTLKKKKQWREEIQAGMQCKEAGKGWRVEGGGRGGVGRLQTDPLCGFSQTLGIILQYLFDTVK